MPDGPSPSSSGGRTRAPTPGNAIAALTRQVERLDAKVDEVERLRQGFHDLATTVAGLAEEVADLAHRSAETEKPAPSWLSPGQPLDEIEAVRLLAELVRWVGRVFVRYGDAELAECWLWHPDVVEELVWLRAARAAAYLGPMASVQRAADWHDRQRPGVVRRVRAVAGTCSLREHFEQPSRPHPPRGRRRPCDRGVVGQPVRSDAHADR